jgi:hypothetical protein
VEDPLYHQSLMWMIANGIRWVRVGATVGYTFKSYLRVYDQKS